MPPAPKPALPNPAATLPGEVDILATVIADLSDDTAKLVYADWLQDRDDPRGPLLRNFVTAFRAGKKLPSVKSAPKPWRDLVGITLMAEVRSDELKLNVDQLLALARPALNYKSVKASEKGLPVGASKLGGRPDMPLATKWPKFDGKPLAFLGQFNLADLQLSPVARDLPATGVFSAFCRYEEEEGNDDFPKGSWRLFYFPNASALVRCELDAELPDGSWFPSCRLSYTEILTIPDKESPWERELDAIGDMDWDGPYTELHQELCPGDHLLGYPFPIQGDVLYKKSVRHLLTICGNDETGWEWGDGGALYFTLSEADLKAGRFDRVKMEMDCA